MHAGGYVPGHLRTAWFPVGLKTIVESCTVLKFVGCQLKSLGVRIYLLLLQHSLSQRKALTNPAI